MDTSKYSPSDRKAIKRAQRTAAWQDIRRQRAELEAKLAEQRATIAKLRQALAVRGASSEEINKLAAAA